MPKEKHRKSVENSECSENSENYILDRKYIFYKNVVEKHRNRVLTSIRNVIYYL